MKTTTPVAPARPTDSTTQSVPRPAGPTCQALSESALTDHPPRLGSGLLVSRRSDLPDPVRANRTRSPRLSLPSLVRVSTHRLPITARFCSALAAPTSLTAPPRVLSRRQPQSAPTCSSHHDYPSQDATCRPQSGRPAIPRRNTPCPAQSPRLPITGRSCSSRRPIPAPANTDPAPSTYQPEPVLFEPRRLLRTGPHRSAPFVSTCQRIRNARYASPPRPVGSSEREASGAAAHDSQRRKLANMDAMSMAEAGTPNADFGATKRRPSPPPLTGGDAGGGRSVNPAPPFALWR